MQDVIEIRRQLHAHPGVSGDEGFAHDMIVGELRELRADAIHEHVGGYGVVAYWRSTMGETKTIAFRADTDALPSGHRCGHDGHTAILLDFAHIVSSSARRYNIVLVFQPEEETGKGAKKIVASGLLERYHVDAVFGLHNLPGYAKGTVVLNKNTFAAASCGVIYRLIGRSTHASTPEMGLNPGLAIAEIITEMNRLNVNTKNDLRQTTLICCRIGEEAFGTSAGRGEVMFTLRTLTNEGMDDLMRQVDGIVLDAAGKGGFELEKQLREPFRATENTPGMVEQLETILSSADDSGISSVVYAPTFRWSEDFAEYLRVCGGAFFGLGSGETQPELHHPEYNFPDDIIGIGSKCFELIMNNIVI